MCPTGSFIFLLFLWLAVLAASVCVITMVRRETGRATAMAGGGSVEESGEGGGRDGAEGGSGDCSLATVLSK